MLRRLLILPVVSLTACRAALLEPAGPVLAAQRTILIDSLAIMLAIVVPTIVATLAFAWWFRAGNRRATYLPTWHFSGSIELVVWSIPVLVILLLGGVTWIGSYQLDPMRPLASKARALEVQVVSLDWKWLFIYPEQGIATVNQLVVPAGVPVHFTLTSASVMNTFFVPRLGSMIYTMNGMQTELNLQADAPGTFHGMSAHFSGDGFSDMQFQVRAVPAAEFAAWAAASRGAGPALDATSYAVLARQSVDVKPSVFGSAEAGLFARIVSQEIAPSAGPGTERHGAAETRKAPQ